jgi:predicted transcriptional regulator
MEGRLEMLELNINEPDRLVTVAHALSTRARIEMLRLLNTRSMNIVEIADTLSLPVSTVASNVKVLEGAKLITTELLPAVRGAMKVCSRSFDDIHMMLNNSFISVSKEEALIYELEMPIGHYSDCEVYPTCGMANQDEMIILEDEPASFYHPKHITAQILWFRKGYLEYQFPLQLPQNAKIQQLEFSMEICSEAPNYDNEWPSDITLWVNGIDVGTWTSPGDFGGRSGKLNPSWWRDTSTQYGLLKTWRIDGERTTLDMQKVSDASIVQLGLTQRPNLRLRIGVKPDAIHKGGINLFGRRFGDYEQEIVMKIQYTLN